MKYCGHRFCVGLPMTHLTHSSVLNKHWIVPVFRMSCMLVTYICMQTLNIITVTDINKESSTPRVLNSSFRKNGPQDRLQEVESTCYPPPHECLCNVHMFMWACVHTWLERMTNRALEGSEKPTISWCQCHLLTCSLSRSRSLTPTLLQHFSFFSPPFWNLSPHPGFSASYILYSVFCRWHKNHLSFLTLGTLLKFHFSHSGCCCCFVPLISLFLRVNTRDWPIKGFAGSNN